MPQKIRLGQLTLPARALYGDFGKMQVYVVKKQATNHLINWWTARDYKKT